MTQHYPRICDPCAIAIASAYRTTNKDRISWAKLYDDAGSFRISIANGCPLCRYLEDRRKMIRPEEEYYPASIGLQERAVADNEDEHHSSFLVVGSDSNSRASQSDFGQFFLRRVPKTTKRQPYISDYSNVTSSGSLKCLRLANEWLQLCVSSHQSCRQSRDISHTSWMPTRLVSCGPKPRILEGDQISVGAPYLTLSHCWGIIPAENRICLTKVTLQDWKQELPDLSSMKTFKDALEVARALGAAYLWIDSLCIIQDSHSDWVTESRTMAQVYKYALCNISATAAKDDSEGCFFPRTPGHSPLPRFQMRLADELGHEQEYELDLLLPGSMIEEVTNGAVNGRGWVLQERIMAARVLHFCKTQMYWECNEWSTQESNYYRSSNQQVLMHERTWHIRPRLIEQGKTKRQHSDTPEMLIKWTQLLTTYVATGLTKSEDILVAVSALARETQQYLQCDYYAGLFEKDFLYQLCWSRKLHSKHRQVSNRTLAPSWSWASFVGAKYFNVLWLNPVMLVEFIGVQVSLCNNDSFGSVDGGVLQLHGRLMPVWFTPREGLSLSSHFGGDVTDHEEETYAWVCFQDQTGSQHRLSGVFSADEPDLPVETHTKAFEKVDPETPTNRKRLLFCLPLLYQLNTLIAVLILERLDNGCYKRVGYVSSHSIGRGRKRKERPHDDGDMALLQMLGKLMWCDKEETELEDLFVDRSGWERISIV